MDVIKEKWEEIIQKLKVEYFLSNISFETWIRPLEVYEIRGNTLYLTVNFKASIEHIQNKYLLPVAKNLCPADRNTKRQYIKSMLANINRENPGVKERLFHSIINGTLEEWNLPYS